MTTSELIPHREKADCSTVCLDVVIGLGSNLGDRLHYLQRAIRLLQQRVRVVATSSVYETQPVGGPKQGPFLNCAARVLTDGSAYELLEVALRVEQSLGRQRREPWGPRTIDLDLLWSPVARSDSAHLTLPHPRLKERAFALVPLLDVAPEACCPDSGLAYDSVLAGLSREGVLRTAHALPCRWTASVEGGTSRAVVASKILSPR